MADFALWKMVLQWAHHWGHISQLFYGKPRKQSIQRSTLLKSFDLLYTRWWLLQRCRITSTCKWNLDCIPKTILCWTLPSSTTTTANWISWPLMIPTSMGTSQLQFTENRQTQVNIINTHRYKWYTIRALIHIAYKISFDLQNFYNAINCPKQAVVNNG